MDWRIPLGAIDFGVEEEAAVLDVLRSRWLTMGGVTQAFESEFAASVGARHAIAVSNATAALHLACLACGLGAGDEVIVPSLSFVATANAVRYVGATPVFADITSEDDLTLSVESIRRCLTPQTRAIIVMHYGGYACDMTAILSLAQERDLFVIEDAAHADGSILEGRALGTWGQVGCYSFFSNKNMTTGEGGMLVTNDDGLAERLRILRSHGMTSLTWQRHQGHAWSYDVTAVGYNYRIDEIRSAIGRVQLTKLEHFNVQRAQIVNWYNEYLQELAPSLHIPFRSHPGESCHHIFPVLLPVGGDRPSFMEAMKAQRIQTSIHYPPIHTFSAYQGLYPMDGGLPVTEGVSRREVTLPLYPGLTQDEVLFVAQAVQRALHESAND
ncbi:MAG: DegT/DnrJ/EryC1/StrS family aminotransferase [Chloroflexi bacterium]|nr:DegT/DnrJ/EryC1/StrS family aminotransferase [Chloroflexota bacterium]